MILQKKVIDFKMKIKVAVTIGTLIAFCAAAPYENVENTPENIFHHGFKTMFSIWKNWKHENPHYGHLSVDDILDHAHHFAQERTEQEYFVLDMEGNEMSYFDGQKHCEALGYGIAEPFNRKEIEAVNLALLKHKPYEPLRTAFFGVKRVYGTNQIPKYVYPRTGHSVPHLEMITTENHSAGDCLLFVPNEDHDQHTGGFYKRAECYYFCEDCEITETPVVVCSRDKKAFSRRPR